MTHKKIEAIIYLPEREIAVSEKKFNDETSNTIWNKLKGKDVPKDYTDKDKEDIVKRYWHRAMESEQ